MLGVRWVRAGGVPKVRRDRKVSMEPQKFSRAELEAIAYDLVDGHTWSPASRRLTDLIESLGDSRAVFITPIVTCSDPECSVCGSA